MDNKEQHNTAESAQSTITLDASELKQSVQTEADTSTDTDMTPKELMQALQTEAARDEAGSESSDPSEKLRGETDTTLEIDLSDPTGYELLLDEDKPAETRRDEQIRDAHKTILEMDLRHQKGVEVFGERVRVPGRVALWPVTLLQILFNVIGFSFGLIHFSIISPNYLLALFVIAGILFAQTVIYHTSYRTMRRFMMVVTVLGTLGIMAFVGWAYYDLLVNPPFPEKPRFLLGVSFVGFSLNVFLMFLHFVFLGHGYHWIEIKVKAIQPEREVPTRIMKKVQNEG
ncbi:MAG: hypothetical protein J6A01_01470 [Proteobacteria bacterium]|nr:hypothetical protein [Pseudomonadota bacterium]